MDIHPIRTAVDHQRALAELTALLEAAPESRSTEADRVEVLGILIEHYEEQHFPVELPTAIDAIRFRMDQLDMVQKDLVPYIGSASKVSEVLNGKRPLSKKMICALHDKLGIPADALLKTPEPRVARDEHNAFPLREMYKRGYFVDAPARYEDFKRKADQWLDVFLHDAGVQNAGPAYARSTAHYRSARMIQPNAFLAWQARILQKASELPVATYRCGIVDMDFMRRVAAQSVEDEAPKRVCRFLADNGIRVLVEPHLPKTYLDGAALRDSEGRPVIGLTLRYDRLDNFWFTLLHELAHVGWHLSDEQPAFFDELDALAEVDSREQEADQLASDALIAPTDWQEASLSGNVTPASVRAFAHAVSRHPAIVAGRIRRDNGNYKKLTKLVGHGQVRQLFNT